MKTPEDLKTLEAMNRFGGSFVHSLATTCMLADTDNFATLRASFPALWERYRRLGAGEPILQLPPEEVGHVAA